MSESRPPPSRRTQILRLRRVALAAVREFGLADGRLRFITHGENTTFRHSGASGDLLVRVHRPARHGRDLDATTAIESEIAWLRAIRSATTLDVPAALTAPDGRSVIEVTAGGLTRACTVLEWMPGRIHEDHPRAAHFERIGAALATLHAHADGWKPPPGFARIRWDHETFFGDVMIYGDTTAAECRRRLPADLRARFDRVGERLAPIMAADSDTGLIHADAHLGNAVFEGDRVKLIDFDDCGTGPRLYDLAVALWEQRDEPEHDRFRDALLSGYRSVRAIDTTHLDDYIALRQVAFALWYTGTAQVNPAFAERLDVVNRWSADMLDLIGFP